MKAQKMLKLLELMKLKEQMSEFLNELLCEISAAESIAISELEKAIDVDEIFLELAKENKDVFTEEELDAQIAFFSSSVGKSIVQKVDSLASISDSALGHIENRINQFFTSRNAKKDQGNMPN